MEIKRYEEVNESILWEKIIYFMREDNKLLTWTKQRWRWVWLLFINIHGVKYTGGKSCLKNSDDTRRKLYKMHKFRFEIEIFKDVRFWESLLVKIRRKKILLFQYEVCKLMLDVGDLITKISSSPMFFYNTTNCCILSCEYIR